MRFAIVCVGILLFAVASQARPLSPAQKRADFEQLASMIESHYGPYEFKKQRFGLDAGAMAAAYSKRAEHVSNLDFFHLINQYVAEFQDSHFRTSVNTSHTRSLGLVADRIGGKVLIDQIDRQLLPEARFPFERGDEIVALDGTPADEVVANLAKHIAMGNPETALRMAAMLIGMRPAALVPLPERDMFSTITVRRGTSSVTKTVPALWVAQGELEPDSNLTWSSPVPPNYEQISVESVFEHFPQTEQAFRCSGRTRTEIPAGAQPVVIGDFIAYYHPTPKGNIGYLRIPHYNWGDKSEIRFQQYEYAIDELEKNTVGLVIDQDHNCGGSVFFLESMVGLFVDKPFRGLEFQFLASRSEYLDFRTWVQGDDRFTLMGQDWLGVLAIVRQAWLAGERLSEKTTFHADRLLQPNGVRYTKPVLMLIDEMSGSGGDAFPAMMKGLGRATLMGQRTMGAGGHVVQMPALNNSGNRISMTKSLFYRLDGIAVENNGVEPDITYEPTRDDFLYMYRPYQEAYLEELAKLIP